MLLDRPGDEVVDYKVREVDRVTPGLCEGAPVVTPANVSGTGNLTGAGITTAGPQIFPVASGPYYLDWSAG